MGNTPVISTIVTLTVDKSIQFPIRIVYSYQEPFKLKITRDTTVSIDTPLSVDIGSAPKCTVVIKFDNYPHPNLLTINNNSDQKPAYIEDGVYICSPGSYTIAIK